jgi:Tfp pilus assembly protein PilN
MDTLFWMVVGVGVLLVLNLLLGLLTLLATSSLAKVLESQKTLAENMQTLSDQMTDVVEKVIEAQKDTRQLTIHFTKFIRSRPAGKSWDSFL